MGQRDRLLNDSAYGGCKGKCTTCGNKAVSGTGDLESINVSYQTISE